MARLEAALPRALQTLRDLREGVGEDVPDADAMRVWEVIFTVFAHAGTLEESIANDVLVASGPAADLDVAHQRSAVLESLSVLRTELETALERRIAAMPFKPRVYRLADHLKLSKKELRALVFIVMSCAGIEGPGFDSRYFGYRSRTELYNCREFAGFKGSELLSFLSPSRKHFDQGILEVEDEYANSYTESKFRAPREVLKAIYGGELDLDEAMTFGASALADVLAEEPGSVLTSTSVVRLANGGDSRTAGDAKRDLSQNDMVFGDAPSVRERTTDDSAMLDLLSELRGSGAGAKKVLNSEEGENGVQDDSQRPDDNDSSPPRSSDGATPCAGDESPDEADVSPYTNDMEYLEDGFSVVVESTKLYNFREKNNDEDRFLNSKRPVEARQREAEAKLRQAQAHFSRRLVKTRQSPSGFVPRLELLVEKLKLVHFERMIILTLVGSVLSQEVRKTMRADPSSPRGYDAATTVAWLLRVHCPELQEQITMRSFFYRNATLIRSGIVTIDVPYTMPFADLGDFCAELDHLCLDYVAGLQTELDEIMDSARCYTPKVRMENVVLPKKTKDLILNRAETFELFRKVRKDVGFDDIVRYGKGLVILLHGPSGVGKTLFANALASHLGKRIIIMDFAAMTSGVKQHSSTEAYRIVFREAKIHQALVFMDECDELFESRDRGGRGTVTEALKEMEGFDGVILCATNRPQHMDIALHRRISLSIRFEAPDAEHRFVIWQKHLPRQLKLAKDVDLRALSVEFELTGGLIKNAVLAALALAVSRVHADRKAAAGDDTARTVTAEDVEINMTELRKACRLQGRGNMKLSNERRIVPVSGLDTMVASEETLKTLREVVTFEKVRSVLSTRYGFKDRQTRSNCLLVLGPRGCGKTFCASAIGYETGRPLQTISCSEMHSTTESQGSSSQISDIFGQANVAGSVIVIEQAEQLLFEAANTESTASPGLELLFHIQSFDGLVILCCTTAALATEAGWQVHIPVPNRVCALLTSIAILTKPDRCARLQLWRQLIPEGTPLSDDVDAALDGIATKYEMTGSRIASCVRRAASTAAMRQSQAAMAAVTVHDGVDPDDALAKIVSGVDNIEPEPLCAKDLVEACEAEEKLVRALDGSSAWMRGLYV